MKSYRGTCCLYMSERLYQAGHTNKGCKIEIVYVASGGHLTLAMRHP